MNGENEIVIVGAGPSSSYVAWKLASKGFQPIVLEEHPTPGRPEHCTGHIPVDLFENLYPKPPHGLIQNRFRGVILHLPNDVHLKVPFRNLSTCLIDRAAFDLWLAEEASGKGANYHFSSKVEDISFNDGVTKLKVRDNKSNKGYVLRAKLVIDGEGFPPRLLEKMSFPGTSALGSVNAVQAWFTNIKDIEQSFIEVYLTSIYAPSFYAWIAPTGRDSAKVGLATTGSPVQMLRRLLREDVRISERFKKAYRERTIGHQIPLGPPIFKNVDGVIPVGDAAAHIKPTTGGGIAFSLFFASLLADSITQTYDDIKNIYKAYFRNAKRYRPYFKLMNSMRSLIYSIEERKLVSTIRSAYDVEILPTLIETAYLEAGSGHKKTFMKLLRSSSWRWLLGTTLSLVGSAPLPLLKLICSMIPSMVRPLPPLKFYPQG